MKMRASLLRRLATASSLAVAVALAGAPAVAQPAQPGKAEIQQVAAFDHQVTGVTVSKDGRIFVNFPRWTEDAPISVAEVMNDGSITPYPDEAWNSWRNAKASQLSPSDHFVCVQSVVADDLGNLWVVDPAAPGNEKALPGGPKLVKIDLKTKKVVQRIGFDVSVAREGTYLNDVRFSPDGAHAYITDSGAEGAIIVVDLKSGAARRLLAGHPSTQPEKDVAIKTDGQELKRPDGRGPVFAADGIALSKDGKHLYWQALTGRTLYSIPTEALTDPKLSEKAVEAKVEKVGTNGVADGLLIARDGRMYISALEEDAVKVREEGKDPAILVQDKRLRWPDTFAEGPDGTIYVTASHIMDSMWFKPGQSPQLKTELWKIVPRP